MGCHCVGFKFCLDLLNKPGIDKQTIIDIPVTCFSKLLTAQQTLTTHEAKPRVIASSLGLQMTWYLMMGHRQIHELYDKVSKFELI